MTDAVQWMTYAEIAEAFGIGADSARNLVRRKRWSRQMGNDGLARIGVPIDQITAKADSPTSVLSGPPIDGATDTPSDGASGDVGTLVALEVLREHIGRLEAEITSLKDEVSRERARGAQVDALTAILEIERKRSEELKQERDRWSVAAEAFQQQLVDLTNKPQRGFFRWLKGAKRPMYISTGWLIVIFICLVYVLNKNSNEVRGLYSEIRRLSDDIEKLSKLQETMGRAIVSGVPLNSGTSDQLNRLEDKLTTVGGTLNLIEYSIPRYFSR